MVRDEPQLARTIPWHLAVGIEKRFVGTVAHHVERRALVGAPNRQLGEPSADEDGRVGAVVGAHEHRIDMRCSFAQIAFVDAMDDNRLRISQPQIAQHRTGTERSRRIAAARIGQHDRVDVVVGEIEAHAMAGRFEAAVERVGEHVAPAPRPVHQPMPEGDLHVASPIV